MRLLSADLDGPVRYADFGGEGPPIVLVHGLGGNHANWLAVGPALAKRGRVLAVDLPGFGRTAPAGRSASVQANRQILSRFIGEVAGSPAIVAGNSMGGLIALMQASSEPDSIAGLILVDPALPRARGSGFDVRVAATFAAYALPIVGETYMRSRAARLGPEGVVRETLRACTVDPSRVPAECVAEAIEIARWRLSTPWSHKAFLQAARSLVAMLARSARFSVMIRSITAPTLIVHGEHDRLVPVAAARALAASRPEWTLEVFDDIGHTPQLEAPERFAAAVGRWLDAGGRAAVRAARGAIVDARP